MRSLPSAAVEVDLRRGASAAVDPLSTDSPVRKVRQRVVVKLPEETKDKAYSVTRPSRGRPSLPLHRCSSVESLLDLIGEAANRTSLDAPTVSAAITTLARLATSSREGRRGAHKWLSDARVVDLIERQLVEHLDDTPLDFAGSRGCTLLWALGMLQWDDSKVPDRLSAEVLGDLDALSIKDMTQATIGLAAIRSATSRSPPSRRRQRHEGMYIDLLLKQLSQRLVDHCPPDVTDAIVQTATALSKAGVHNVTLVGRLAGLALPHLTPSLPTKQLGMLLWAMSVMSYPEGVSLPQGGSMGVRPWRFEHGKVVEELLERIAEWGEGRDWAAEDPETVAWVVVGVGLLAWRHDLHGKKKGYGQGSSGATSMLMAFLERVGEEVDLSPSRLSDHGLSNLLTGLSKASISPSSTAWDRIASSLLTRHPSDIKPWCLLACLVAFGENGRASPPIIRAAQEALSERLLREIHTLRSHELCMIARSMARLRVRNGLVMERIAAQATRLLRMERLQLWEISVLLWSFAILEFRPRDFLECSLVHMLREYQMSVPGSAASSQVNLYHLASAVWSCAKLFPFASSDAEQDDPYEAEGLAGSSEGQGEDGKQWVREREGREPRMDWRLVRQFMVDAMRICAARIDELEPSRVAAIAWAILSLHVTAKPLLVAIAGRITADPTAAAPLPRSSPYQGPPFLRRLANRQLVTLMTAITRGGLLHGAVWDAFRQEIHRRGVGSFSPNALVNVAWAIKNGAVCVERRCAKRRRMESDGEGRGVAEWRKDADLLVSFGRELSCVVKEASRRGFRDFAPRRLCMLLQLVPWLLTCSAVTITVQQHKGGNSHKSSHCADDDALSSLHFPLSFINAAREYFAQRNRHLKSTKIADLYLKARPLPLPPELFSDALELLEMEARRVERGNDGDESETAADATAEKATLAACASGEDPSHQLAWSSTVFLGQIASEVRRRVRSFTPYQLVLLQDTCIQLTAQIVQLRQCLSTSSAVSSVLGNSILAALTQVVQKTVDGLREESYRRLAAMNNKDVDKERRKDALKLLTVELSAEELQRALGKVSKVIVTVRYRER
ncbi:unnamed protein product [Vitrella brassicaformis CCMP3155]|uniref:Uncharacterized protein n=1 Tax=Vitrella brassicaformis (strain CCMP3155) TaxID=1169540 RepID=A0A0G4FS35_VITBC|nr:unnamed protein product [Vitrella brassicaformis CCMP3155]|eukprot:CEM17489.1 unnamed protein product [Vitrella brassicaformis CCMP3155]